MPELHLEDAIRHGIERLQASVVDLIENSQALARSALIEGADVVEQGRRQARSAAHDAFDYSRDRAMRSYDQFGRIAGRQPMATTTIALGVGLVLGFIICAASARPALAARKAETAPEPETVKPEANSTGATTKPAVAARKSTPRKAAAPVDGAPRPAPRKRAARGAKALIQ